MRHITYCPGCGYSRDRHTDLYGEDKPQPNDFSICFDCALICKFDQKLDLIKVPDAELQLLQKNDIGTYRKLIEARDKIIYLKFER